MGHYQYPITVGEVNKLISDFKIPIAILAIIFPSAAFAVSLHRSKQTEVQIALLMNQNNFNNYFKHLEEFSKYIGKYEGVIRIKSEDLFVEELHSYLFNDSLEGKYNPCKAYVDSDKIIKIEFKDKIKEASNKLTRNLTELEKGFLKDGFDRTQEVKKSLELKYSELYQFWDFDELNAIKLKEFYTYMDFTRKFLAPKEEQCLDTVFLNEITQFDDLSKRFKNYIESIKSLQKHHSSIASQ